MGSSAPLEGMSYFSSTPPEATRKLEKPIAQAGAAVFVAHDKEGIVLAGIVPHFAVIDPVAAEGRGRGRRHGVSSLTRHPCHATARSPSSMYVMPRHTLLSGRSEGSRAYETIQSCCLRLTGAFRVLAHRHTRCFDQDLVRDRRRDAAENRNPSA